MGLSSTETFEAQVDREPWPQKRSVRQRQDQVNDLFTDESEFWTNLYQQEEDVYAAIHRLRLRLALSWIESLHLPPGSRVLEVGCGAGFLTVELAKRGLAVTATDAVQAMLEKTQNAVVKAGYAQRVALIRSDVHGLSFEDTRFAFIVALGLIPWLHTPGKALQEMARVLEPGGCLIVNSDNRWRLTHVVDPRRFPLLTPLRRSVRSALERGRLLRAPAKRRLSQAHSLREFNQMLADAGFEREKHITFGFGPFTFLNCAIFPDVTAIKLHRKLQQLADRKVPFLRSSGCQYLVLARKNPQEV